MVDTTGSRPSYACYSDDPFWHIYRQFDGGVGGYSGVVSSVGSAVAGTTAGVVVGVVVVAATTTLNVREETKAEAEAVTITQSSDPYHQEYFPLNPLEFAPLGLVMRVYVNMGDKNGGIIKWEIPGTKIAIFEWNQDLVYGAHYHVMLDTWSNKHLDPFHYKAGDPVPEPWNTLYFGYK